MPQLVRGEARLTDCGGGIVEPRAARVAIAKRRALGGGERKIVTMLALDLRGQVVDQDARDGTERASCDFGVPQTRWPCTSIIASATTSRRRRKSMLLTRRAASSHHRSPQ